MAQEMITLTHLNSPLYLFTSWGPFPNSPLHSSTWLWRQYDTYLFQTSGVVTRNWALMPETEISCVQPTFSDTGKHT